MDKVREEFEKMCSTIGVSTTKITVVERGVATAGYQNDEVNEMFGVFCFAWQASRTALCVELPKGADFAKDACSVRELVAFDFAVTVIARKLDDAGVTHKQPK